MINDKNFQEISNLVGFELSKLTQERFKTFVQLFKFYNSHTNLVSKNDEDNLFEKHIYDSLALALFFNKYNIDKNIKLLDIGTGGGFPSVPLSIIYPEMSIYPLDSISKKIGFIELVQKELRLDCLNPICKRVEDFADDNRGTFDIVTSRAVASLNVLLEYAIPMLKRNAYFVAFKSKSVDSEIDNAQNALQVLGCDLVERIKYSLPTEQEYIRELVIIKKVKNTPALYPRKSGLPKKKPL